MVPQSGSQEVMVSEQRHILLLLPEIYNAVTLLQDPISSHFGVVTIDFHKLNCKIGAALR
jgi:hypothetical protein